MGYLFCTTSQLWKGWGPPSTWLLLHHPPWDSPSALWNCHGLVEETTIPPTCKTHQPEAGVPPCPPQSQHTPQCCSPIRVTWFPPPTIHQSVVLLVHEPSETWIPSLIHPFISHQPEGSQMPTPSGHHSVTFLPFLRYWTPSHTTVTLSGDL